MATMAPYKIPITDSVMTSGVKYFAPLVVLLIGAGVYPKPVLDIINPAVKVTMSQVHTTDPKPAHPAGDTTAAQKGTAP